MAQNTPAVPSGLSPQSTTAKEPSITKYCSVLFGFWNKSLGPPSPIIIQWVWMLHTYGSDVGWLAPHVWPSYDMKHLLVWRQEHAFENLGFFSIQIQTTALATFQHISNQSYMHITFLKHSIIGNEHNIILHLQAGMPGLLKLDHAGAFFMQGGPDIWYWSIGWDVGKADQNIQLGQVVIENGHWLNITRWKIRSKS